MAKSSSSLVRSQRKREGQKVSAIVSKIFKLIVFQIDHVSLTSADSYRCDSYCLARVFQKLPTPPKHNGIFDVFCDFQRFFQLENLGSHLAMCPDDRFLPQGKQILQKNLPSATHAIAHIWQYPPPPGSVPRDRSCVGLISRYSRTEINLDGSNSGSCNSTRMPSSY